MARKPTKQTPPSTDTPFRRAERYWKRRAEPIDLGRAFDVEQVAWSSDGEEGVWTHSDGVTRVLCRKVDLDDGVLSREGMGQSRWKGKGKDEEANNFAVVIPAMPGLVLLPSLLPPRLQRALTLECLHNTKLPNLTSLSPHYDLPQEGLWDAWTSGGGATKVRRIDRIGEIGGRSEDRRETVNFEAVTKENWQSVAERGSNKGSVGKTPAAQGDEGERYATVDELLSRLRWTNIGYHYDWTSKSYAFERGVIPLPPLIESSCRAAVHSIPWDKVFSSSPSSTTVNDKDAIWKNWKVDYKPEAGIINFYQLRDSLTAHIDHSELDPVRPLVSFSIGHSAVFLVGGPSRDISPLSVILRSGDGLIMSGKEGRRVFHGLPRVLEGTLPDYLSAEGDSISLDDDGDSAAFADDWERAGQFLERGTRININVREVF